MSDKIQNSEIKKDEMTPFDYFTEIVGWLQIVASPFLLGLVLAAIIYFSNPSTLRLVVAFGVSLIFLIFGIVLATRIWKKKGTMNFISRITATPDLDNLGKEKK